MADFFQLFVCFLFWQPLDVAYFFPRQQNKEILFELVEFERKADVIQIFMLSGCY